MEYILQMVVVAILGIICTYLYERKWKRFPNLLPGPVRFPFIGSVIQAIWTLVLKPGTSSEKFHTFCKKYGSTNGFQAGLQYFVVTEDIETAKELMSSELWHNRAPTHPMYKEMTFNENLGILECYGPVWKEIRKFTIKKLTEKGFGNLHTADSYLSQEIEYFIQEFENYRAEHNNDIVVHQYFNISVFNIIWRFIAGTRFQYNDAQIKDILHLMEKTNRTIQIGAAFALPFLRFIPGLGVFDSMIDTADSIYKLFRDIMIERRVHGNFRHVQNDFIDEFLFMIDKEKDNNSSIYTDNQFLQCGTDLLIAGSDTTSNSIEFTLLFLTKYPKVQDKLREEIDAAIGRRRLSTVFDKQEMPYAEAVMLEVLRHANVIPINTRSSTQDTTLNGCDVPKHSFAMINLVQIHHDKKLWGDPDAFRPERFLDENMNVVNKEKLFAFGGGKRLCIGLAMAKITWFAFITTLIQRYTFEPSPTHPELDTVPDSGFANMPRPFRTLVKLREGHLPTILRTK